MANGYIEGTNHITVDIVDRAEDLVGPGDIMTCLGVTYTEVLNDAGQWSARFPPNDPIVGRLQLKKHFMHVYVDGKIFCYGLAERWDWELDNDDQQILVISGRDSLAELDETSLANWTDGDFGVSNTPFQIVEEYNTINGYDQDDPAAWTLAKGIEDDEYPVTDIPVYTKFQGETVLRGLVRIAEHTGESFRLAQTEPIPQVLFYTKKPKRHVEWLGNQVIASGVRAVGGAGDAVEAESNPFVCFIQNLTERRDTSKLLTLIYPFGSGLGETRLDSAGIVVGTHVTLPAGFTLNTTTNALENTTASAALGKTISKEFNFKDIRPLFNTDADVLEAKIYLVKAALAFLQRNDDEDDTLEYDLSVLQLPSHVKVGMTLRVVWQDARRNIDTDLVLLAKRKVVRSNGERTYTLTVATGNQWRFRETSNIVAQVEEGQIFLGHPQIDGTGYWKSYKEIVGDSQTDHMAEIPFFLSAEVVQVVQILFRYKVDRPLIAVKSYALAATDTGASGTEATGASAPGTSDSGGASTTGDTAAGTTDTSGSSTTGDTASGITGGSGVSVTGDSPSGQTDTSGADTSGATASGITGNESFAGDPHTHTTTGTHTHSTPAHSHITTGNHSHTTPDHTHITTGVHAHTTPNHSHITTAVHAHTTPAHTHAHSATHTHTGPSHTHTAPALVTTYNMEFIDASLTYTQSQLQYSVNGGEWFGLDGTSAETGIPVTDGFYEVDITSRVQNPAGLKRPYQEYNKVQIQRKDASPAGKMAQIRVELGVRVTTQSVVIFS